MDPRYRFELDEPCCRCLNNQGEDSDEPCIHCKWNLRSDFDEARCHFKIIDGDQYADNVEAYLRAVSEGVI